MADVTPENEYVIFRGERWLVADSRFDRSDLEDGVGSHWHLTLTAGQPLGANAEAERLRTALKVIAEWPAFQQDPFIVCGRMQAAALEALGADRG